MRRKPILSLCVLLLVIGMGGDALAQMFGQRTLGKPLSRRTSARGTAPGTQENVGQIQGSERFLRGNRSAREFVGAAARERRTFVGQQGAEVTGPVVSAVRDLQPQREVNLNRPEQRSRRGQMYSPRLRADFSFNAPDNSSISARIADQLQATETLNSPLPIEVSVADGTATLRGVVASKHDRELAELLVRFEPGISAVQNELQVQPSLSRDRQQPNAQPRGAPPGSGRAPATGTEPNRNSRADSPRSP